MWALPGHHLRYLASTQSVWITIETMNVGTSSESVLLPSIDSKCVKHNRNGECGHSHGISLVTWHLLRACKTQEKHCMWALLRNQFCDPACAQSMQNTIETFNVGTPREATSLPASFKNMWNARDTLSVGTPKESILLPSILSKHVKHNRNEHGHSQGISFVAQYPLNVCTMQWKHGMWALPGNQFSAPAFSQSMWKAIETFNVGTASEWTLLPGVLSKHEHGRNLEGGHSQGLNCVTQHPLKACKT